MRAKKPENITLLPFATRVKLIRDRLSSVPYPNITNLPKPAKVLAAEKVVGEWKARNQNHRDAQHQVFRDKRNAVTDAFIVGDMQTALQLLRDLENVQGAS